MHIPDLKKYLQLLLTCHQIVPYMWLDPTHWPLHTPGALLNDFVWYTPGGYIYFKKIFSSFGIRCQSPAPPLQLWNLVTWEQHQLFLLPSLLIGHPQTQFQAIHLGEWILGSNACSKRNRLVYKTLLTAKVPVNEFIHGKQTKELQTKNGFDLTFIM